MAILSPTKLFLTTPFPPPHPQFHQGTLTKTPKHNFSSEHAELTFTGSRMIYLWSALEALYDEGATPIFGVWLDCFHYFCRFLVSFNVTYNFFERF